MRRPAALRAWLASYAAATSTTASYNKILDAATPGESEKPSRITIAGYREALQRMWLLDPLPAWWPTFKPLERLTQAPKHHLADPALAAVLVDATEATLLEGRGPTRPDGESFLGLLFESLAVLTVRSIAAGLGANTSHLRMWNGEHEIDLIVEGHGGALVAIDKLATAIVDRDVKHLNWLQNQLGDHLTDRVIINAGPTAYRRADGVAVVPLALLGP